MSRMSVSGTKQTHDSIRSMSAFEGEADATDAVIE